jgi:alanyl-tRNA synthetase
LDRTPFYAESGGQVGDQGQLIGEGNTLAKVVDTYSPVQGVIVHKVEMQEGTFNVGDIVAAEVDVEKRDATRRNHTATHLMHAALREVLGTHVKQAGSVVAPTYLRFDYSHYQPLTAEEKEEIERLVNYHILRNEPVQTDEMAIDEAMRSGAMALFGEKYGDRVRVVNVAGFSKELCGGTHVRATGDIGPFVITEESGVAAGVRRIEALTGLGAVQWIQQQREQFGSVLGALNAAPAQAVDSVQRLQADARRLAREVDGLKMKLALGGGGATAGGAGDGPQLVDGVKLIAKRVAGLEKAALRGLSDTLRDRLGSGVVLLVSDNEGKVSLVVSVSKDLTDRVKAGNLVKALAPIVGGSGGGRPDFAEAGGKDSTRIDDLLRSAPQALSHALGTVQQN